MQKSSVGSPITDNRHNGGNQAQAIATNFSKRALSYDNFAKVQKFASTSLCKQIAKNMNTCLPANILEIGCGTGLLSRCLVNRFPDSKIDFIDPAAAMLSLCEKNINDHLNSETTSKNHNFIKMTIEDYLSDRNTSLKQYSLIVSSFTLQWVHDLPSIINSLVDRLEKGGQFFFSYPTDKSFPEWKSVCQKIDLPFSGNKLPSAKELDFYVNPSEVSVVWNESPYRLAFPNALEFFREMKNIGANLNTLARKTENGLQAQRLSIKDFRRLLKTWDQECSETINIKKPIKTLHTYDQTIDCTYWFVEGIITRCV